MTYATRRRFDLNAACEKQVALGGTVGSGGLANGGPDGLQLRPRLFRADAMAQTPDHSETGVPPIVKPLRIRNISGERNSRIGIGLANQPGKPLRMNANDREGFTFRWKTFPITAGSPCQRSCQAR